LSTQTVRSCGSDRTPPARRPTVDWAYADRTDPHTTGLPPPLTGRLVGST
jgi:hypothetical protein